MSSARDTVKISAKAMTQSILVGEYERLENEALFLNKKQRKAIQELEEITKKLTELSDMHKVVIKEHIALNRMIG
jgi:hypothetical protein